MKLIGRFKVKHYRGGKLLKTYKFNNGIVTAGKNSILDIMFHAATQLTTWYLGLIDNYLYTGLNALDTMGSHSGWQENTDYSETNRPAWNEGAASDAVIASTSDTTFTITDDATIKGIFVTSNNTKGGTGGALWSTALFDGGDVIVTNGDELKVSYELGIE